MSSRAARHLLVLTTCGALAACGRLDQLATSPPVTPAQWCQQRPCITVGNTVVNEPWSTALVFVLAAVWLASGIYFLVTRQGQRSRSWLGVALILGGIGAAQAGVSYQAFSYVLKCQGRDVCLLTDGFEVGYSITQALSVSAMVAAVAFACCSGRLRRGICWYAVINAGVYLAIALLGVTLPSAVLLSFEVLMLFALPGIVIVIVLATRGYVAMRDRLDLSLLIAAVLLVVVQIAYFAYYAAGVTATLWRGGEGIYFSENDVLHVGMIIWLAYVVFAVGPRLRDFTPPASPRDTEVAE